MSRRTATRGTARDGEAASSPLLRALALVGLLGVAAAVAACGPLAARDASPADVGSAAGSGLAASDLSKALAGTWSTEISADDLRAGGVTDPGLLDENSGRFTWRFNDDGTWEQLQESLTGASISNPIWKGSWSVEDGVLTQVTTFPASAAGDTVAFDASISGNQLRLHARNPPDAILPLVTDTHPWKRVEP